MFVPEIQEGRQGPVLALRVERNRKLSYWKNKDSCADPPSCFAAAREVQQKTKLLQKNGIITNGKRFSC